MSVKYDQRKEKRQKLEATIWHDNLFPEIFYEAKMYNFSESGIYFESDQILYEGEKIYIAVKNPSGADNEYKNCVQVQIKWRNNLTGRYIQYGYGAQFVDYVNPLSELIDHSRLDEDTLQRKTLEIRKDSRQDPRSSYRKLTFFTTKNRNHQGFITNISRSGAFIVSRYKFSLGQQIVLDIPGDRRHNNIKLNASVVRLSPKGAGVEFDRRTGIERRKGADRRKNQRIRAD